MKKTNSKQNSMLKLLTAAIAGAVITVTSFSATTAGAEEINKTSAVAKTTTEQAVKVTVPKSIKASDVKVSANKAGNYVVASKVLNNKSYAIVTFTTKVKTKGKVLKLRTSAGLETVAYSLVDNKVKVRVYKPGELVFVAETVSKAKNSAEIQKLISRGILPVGKGKYNVSEEVTVAQFSEALGKAMGLTALEYTEEEDVDDTSEFFSGYNAALAQIGIMEETPYVLNPISRYEAFSTLGNLLKLNGVKSSLDLNKKFKDANELSADQKVPFQLLAQIGALTNSKNVLDIHSDLTTDEMVKVMTKVLKHLEML